MRRFWISLVLATMASAPLDGAWAEPEFVNGLVIPGDTIDATGKPGANAGRFGAFSDIYYDPIRKEWWALSDRGPGGGVLDYATRVQRFTVDVHPVTQVAGPNPQRDVYVDFQGGSHQRDIDSPTMLNGVFVGPVPAGFTLIPAVLHAFKASANDLAGYVRPGQEGHKRHGGHNDDEECDDDDRDGDDDDRD
jgi:hypothetical protein